MAKRYYQGKKDRMDEKYGMKESFSKSYMGHDKMKHSEMVSEDYSAIANLPQGVVYKSYPATGYDRMGYLNDTMSGIESQVHADDRKLKSNKPEKY